MNTKNEYIIPAGTQINTRNVTAELRLRKRVTETELRFADLANTGDGGFIYYFEHGDWLIAVNSDDVQNAAEYTPANIADPAAHSDGESSVLFPSVNEFQMANSTTDQAEPAIFGPSPLDKSA